MTEEAEEGEWTIDEATKRFQIQNEGHFWRTAFKEGVNLDEKILEGIASDKTPEEYVDYIARYDFAFLTPCGSQIRFKVRSDSIAINCNLLPYTHKLISQSKYRPPEI